MECRRRYWTSFAGKCPISDCIKGTRIAAHWEAGIVIIRRLLLVSMLLIAAAASAQVVEMRVQLSWADTPSFSQGLENLSTHSDQAVSAPGTTIPSNSVTNLSIHVLLLNSNGSTIAEKFPDSQGIVTFTVSSYVVTGLNQRILVPYSIRVYGDRIKDQTIDNLVPGEGDRYVSISLHRKDEGRSPGGGVVSANALRVPKKARKELEKGSQAFGENQFESAREHFEKAIAEYPEYDEAYNRLGGTLMKMGDVDGGTKAFRKAIEVNAKFMPAYLNLAQIAARNKRYDEASDLLRQAHSIEPLDPKTLGFLCEYDLLRGKMDDVPATAAKLHKLPHAGFAICHLGAADALVQSKKFDLAIAEYKMFIQEAPDHKLVPRAKDAVRQLEEQQGGASKSQ